MSTETLLPILVPVGFCALVTAKILLRCDWRSERLRKSRGHAASQNASSGCTPSTTAIPLRLGHMTHKSDYRWTSDHEKWTEHYVTEGVTIEVPLRSFKTIKTPVVCSVCGKKMIVKARGRRRVITIGTMILMVLMGPYICALLALGADSLPCFIVLILIPGLHILGWFMGEFPGSQFRVYAKNNEKHDFFDWPKRLI